ncbi:unnamed protein product [Effrenium voratum]|nr:unnamed protein product [Effrenium voratum]CAJ1403421.1 unnamed protein product [Effrenium voratum]
MGRRFPVAGNCSHFEWPEVRFQAGSLRARGYVNGQVVAMTSVSTTGPASALRVAFKDGLGAVPKSKEVALISIEVVDQHGNLVPTASNVITVTGLAGATVLGTCSGDPADQVPNASPWRNAFGGRLLAVARAAPGARLAVTSPGLPTAELQWPSTLVV